jgi:hypothetical protein
MADTAPDLTAEMALLLERAGRPDLAAQVGALAVGTEESSGEDGRRSFYSGHRQREYSLEFDSRQGLILIDVAADSGIVAIHVLAPED